MDTKQQKLDAFKSCMAEYCLWFEQQIGFAPRIDGSDGKGLKQTVDYLFKITQTEKGVVDSFSYILYHWDELDAFYQKQVRLRQINSNLVNILNFFRNAKHSKTGVSSSYLQGLVEKVSDTQADTQDV